MTRAAHTLGPWEATERSGYREILGPRTGATFYGNPDKWAVAYIDTDLPEEVQNANARLIASAPELLEFAQAFHDCMARDGFHGDAPDELFAKARAAINLARGAQ